MLYPPCSHPNYTLGGIKSEERSPALIKIVKACFRIALRDELQTICNSPQCISSPMLKPNYLPILTSLGKFSWRNTLASVFRIWSATNKNVRELTKLGNAIQAKISGIANCKGVAFYHDIAKLHTSLVTSQKLLDLGWNVTSAI